MSTSRSGFFASACVLSLWMACGGDEPEKPAPSPEGGVEDAGDEPEPDADSDEPDAQLLPEDADTPPAYEPPSPVYPTTRPSTPFLLSQVGLYSDFENKTFAPDLIAFEPASPLWSDGANKDRHLRLPPGTVIDSSDMDHWRFPVGSVLFKEFSRGDQRLETRVIARTGPGPRDYFFGAFLWRDDESDAELVWDGAKDVRGTDHDVPTHTQCGTCHQGEPGRVLGFSAVQMPDVDVALLSDPPAQRFQAPGDDTQRDALMYLHANCAHCHNPTGSARPDTDLFLGLSVHATTLEDTNVLESALGVPLQYFDNGTLSLRIAPGKPDESGVYFRMSQRGPRTQMPALATEHVDETGLALIGAFIRSL